MAKRYEYDTSTDALLRPAKNAAYFDQWGPADFENDDLLCAEMSRLAYSNQEVVNSSLSAAGFSLVGFIGGEDPGSRAQTGGTQAFLAASEKRGVTIVAFRGTESDRPEDLIADLMTLPVPSASGKCRVHGGFKDRYDRVSDRLKSALAKRERKLLVTGHSLGAALATLAAVDARPEKLITFGSPLAGDSRFRELLQDTEIHRFVDCCDVVARVPPARFDTQHLFQLLSELTGFDSITGKTTTREKLAQKVGEEALKLASAAIAEAFHRVDPNIEFAHVSSPRYIRADGTIAGEINEDDISSDQKAARAQYPHPLTGAEFHEILGESPKLAEISPDNIPRIVGQSLKHFFGIGQVPSRDLADHAPINYVSAFTGRV